MINFCEGNLQSFVHASIIKFFTHKQTSMIYTVAMKERVSSFQSDQLDDSLGLNLLCSKIDLLFLPNIPKFFTHYSYFIPISSPIILFLFYYVNDNIKMKEWLCIIYMVTDCFNRNI